MQKKAQPKNPVELGGYTYDIVDEPFDMFICKICHLVSKNAYKTSHFNHTFCKLCIIASVRKRHLVCPICRATFEISKLVQINRQIRTLEIYCTNKDSGCTWEGPLKHLDTHLKACPAELPCKY